jgi:hypothetical protein
MTRIMRSRLFSIRHTQKTEQRKLHIHDKLKNKTNINQNKENQI